MKKYVTSFEEFGYEVNDGWLEIVKRIPYLVEQYNRNRTEQDKIEVDTIKQKFGELRVYIISSDGKLISYIPGLSDEINRIIDECNHTCEWCGTKENVTTSSYKGWIRTLCEKCNEKLKNKN